MREIKVLRTSLGPLDPPVPEAIITLNFKVIRVTNSLLFFKLIKVECLLVATKRLLSKK